jgi:hypothetical protein
MRTAGPVLPGVTFCHRDDTVHTLVRSTPADSVLWAKALFRAVLHSFPADFPLRIQNVPRRSECIHTIDIDFPECILITR